MERRDSTAIKIAKMEIAHTIPILLLKNSYIIIMFSLNFIETL